MKNEANVCLSYGLCDTSNRPCVGQVTINMLPDDALLQVFHHCREEDPFHSLGVPHGSYNHRYLFMRMWKILVHVCRRWRRIIFTSPQHLHLLLACNNRTPVRESLGIWPPLPIMISYWPQARGINGDKNIIAALEHQDRITKIFFSGISSFVLKKFIPLMQVPLPALTELEVWGKYAPLIPETFLGGSAPRLQSCTLHDVAFPALPKLLISTIRLVDLSFRDIPNSGYISPETMTTCLATLPNLERLCFGFQSSISCPDPRSQPPLARAILPSLTYFQFEGGGGYLEELVARIDAPFLHQLIITFFMDLPFIVSRLPQFIARTERLKELYRAEVTLDPYCIRMTDGSGNRLKLGTKYNVFGWHISSMVWLCNHISPLLSQVESLAIWEDPELPLVEQPVEMVSREWLKVFRLFVTVERLFVSKGLVPGVTHALQRATEVLPMLRSLSLEGLYLSGSEQQVIEPFLAARRVSGHPVVLLK
jgi:hypothetical protein